jgi:hypothetical protein
MEDMDHVSLERRKTPLGIIKEIIIWVLSLIFGWAIVFFITGGAIGLGFIMVLMELFPILVKPVLVIGFIFGCVFLLGRKSK